MLGKKLKVVYRTNFSQKSIKAILNNANFSLEGGSIDEGFEPYIKDDFAPNDYVGKLSNKQTPEGVINIVCFSHMGDRLEEFCEKYGNQNSKNHNNET